MNVGLSIASLKLMPPPNNTDGQTKALINFFSKQLGYLYSWVVAFS
jgi:hypothetical protein